MKQQIKINKKDKILIFVFFIFIFLSMVISYTRFIVFKDFEIFKSKEDIPTPLIEFNI